MVVLDDVRHAHIHSAKRQCRPVICAAVAALERRLAGGDAGEAGWRAVRMVLTGLLPECMKAVGMEEQEWRRVEAGVAKAVVEAQAVAARLLGLYGTATRNAARREAGAAGGVVG